MSVSDRRASYAPHDWSYVCETVGCRHVELESHFSEQESTLREYFLKAGTSLIIIIIIIIIIITIGLYFIR